MINKKWIVLAVLVVSLLILLGVTGYYFFSPPRVVTSTPINDDQEAIISSEPITITLNKKVSNSLVSDIELVNTTPSFIKTNVSNVIDGRIEFIGKNINFYVSNKTPLLPQNNYQLSMKLKSRSGFEQKEYVLSFKTESQSGSSLPSDQQDKTLTNIDSLQDGRVAGLEIVKFLPYNTDSFYIIHNVLSNNTVEIVVYLKGDQEKSKQAAIKWIESKGTDPNKLNIKYEENKYF